MHDFSEEGKQTIMSRSHLQKAVVEKTKFSRRFRRKIHRVFRDLLQRPDPLQMLYLTELHKINIVLCTLDKGVTNSVKVQYFYFVSS